MPPQRRFLGTGQPLLHLAVQALIDLYPPAEAGWQAWDLSHLTVVIPSQRARRQLIHHLAAHADAQNRILLPPDTLAPDQFLVRITPPDETIATPRQSLALREVALRQTDPKRLQPLLPQQADHQPHLASLARRLARLSEDLLLENLPLEDLPDRLAHANIDPPAADRYTMIAELETNYLRQLAQYQLNDRWRACRQTIQQGPPTLSTHVLLLGLTDLRPLFAQYLHASPDPVTALVAADPADRSHFGPMGEALHEAWASKPLPITEDSLIWVEDEHEQNLAVAEALADHQPLSPGSAAIVTTKAALNEPIRAAISLAEVDAAIIESRPLSQSAPALCLQLLASFHTSSTYDDLAALIRHSDIDSHLRRSLNPNSTAAIENWVTLLDDYASRYLAAVVSDQWLGKKAPALSQVYAAIKSLLPQDTSSRPLNAWTESLRSVLQKIYAQAPATPGDPDNRQRALQAFLQEIDDLDHLQAIKDHLPDITFAQAVDQLLNPPSPRVIPIPADDSKLPILGVIELAFDTSPQLIVAGLNEGAFPSRPKPDALLPPSVRQRLGLNDAKRREARDRWALHTALTSRQNTTLIAAARSATNDPLLPSLPLLGHNHDTQTRRLHRFLIQRDRPSQRIQLGTPGMRNNFRLVPPSTPIAPPLRLSITALKSYLACPYRFYLRHVLKLNVVEDAFAELDAASFGTLLHNSLARLSQAPKQARVNAGQLTAYLIEGLHEEARRTLGDQPNVPTRVQLRTATERLQAFAPLQIQRWNEGWEITHTEVKTSQAISIDQTTFTLTGRIDRIDQHPDGRTQIIDYKSFDKPKKPRPEHHTKKRGWIDLQLPLYLDLIAQPAIQLNLPHRLLDAGYWVLPAKPASRLADHLLFCGWTEQERQEARDTRDHILSQISQSIYWPPGDPAHFPDGFEALCADLAPDRDELINHSEPNRHG
ncbi:PD-(D/E)XK nuclease family protein [Mucisphaera sp.]|uniref:PD-(D/E)XK nuclease family protein n=1 Tax=Mucisphaera sp. TaxID=2913024 RepID=UPI003D147455